MVSFKFMYSLEFGIARIRCLHNNAKQLEYLQKKPSTYTCTDVSKMHNNMTMYYFTLNQVNNGKCITAAQGCLRYIPV